MKPKPVHITLNNPCRKSNFKLFGLTVSFLLTFVLLYQGEALGKICKQVAFVSSEGGKLSGRVVDYHSGKAIRGVNVYVEGTGYYAVTDKEGRFSIAVSDSVQGEVRLLTEYSSKESYVLESVILEKKGDIKELVAAEVMLYRYPEVKLDELNVVQYVIPLILDESGAIEYIVPLLSNRYRTTEPTGVMTPKEYPEKVSFWFRITKVFRKSEKRLIDVLTTPPQFPGNINKYLALNVRYPVAAHENWIVGKTIVRFIIDEYGKVTDVSLATGRWLGAGLDEEAMRVVRSMPTWQPATYKGKAVRVVYTLPVCFRME